MSTIREPFSLAPDSVREVVGKEAKQVMVYGFHSAKYIDVQAALLAEEHSIQKVFSHAFGTGEETTTVEGKEVEPLKISLVRGKKVSDEKKIERECKTTITSLILENYKRKKRGQPLIPLVFCIEYSDESDKQLFAATPDEVASKEEKFNQMITHGELRRAFKHCTEFETSEDPELRELSKVAQETLKFVRVQRKAGGGQHTLKEIDPLWKAEDWKVVWKKRLDSHSVVQKENAHPKENQWREQLIQQVRKFNQTQPHKSAVIHRFETLRDTLRKTETQRMPLEGALSLPTEKKTTESETIDAIILVLNSFRARHPTHGPEISRDIRIFENMKKNIPESEDDCYKAHSIIDQVEELVQTMLEEELEIQIKDEQEALRQALGELDCLRSSLERLFKAETTSSSVPPKIIGPETIHASINQCIKNLRLLVTDNPTQAAVKERLLASFEQLKDRFHDSKNFLVETQRLVQQTLPLTSTMRHAKINRRLMECHVFLSQSLERSDLGVDDISQASKELPTSTDYDETITSILRLVNILQPTDPDQIAEKERIISLFEHSKEGFPDSDEGFIQLMEKTEALVRTVQQTKSRPE